MCILCVIQKWSRRVATMLPWLVIPLIGLWSLSQLLPPAFRFEITSPRLACVFILLITLFWYEILMPHLSSWRIQRSAMLRERERFEAIEMQKLRRTATRRCRNCLTAYRDQNPGGGKFMCSFCGHVSKRPVLDLPLPPGMSNSGILNDLVGKGGKILNGKAWLGNGWICGRDLPESGSWVDGHLTGQSSCVKRHGCGYFYGDDHCLAEKSYSHIFFFVYNALASFFMAARWPWRKIFWVNSSRDDTLNGAQCRGMLDKGGDSAGNGQESKGEKARRKSEEKRLAKLEKELMEEEERKQREEVARLVEEQRRSRDEKTEAEKDRGKGPPNARKKGARKEAEKRSQERKKERDRGSSESNSDAEELEMRTGKESERFKKAGIDIQEQGRNSSDNVKLQMTEMGHGFKSTCRGSQYRTNAGTRYLDRMRGNFLSTSRAFTGGGFFGKGNYSPAVSREHKSNTFADHPHSPMHKKDTVPINSVSGRSIANVDIKRVSHPVLIEPQPCTGPKKSWHQLFNSSSDASGPSNGNVISRPNEKCLPEVQGPPISANHTAAKSIDNPISFGLPSPFMLPSYTFRSNDSSTCLPSVETIFSNISAAPYQYLPDESEIFEDPCYVPDPISLLRPVSDYLNHFQLDLGFVTDLGFDRPCPVKTETAPSEITKPSPIESPLSRSRVFDQKISSPFHFPGAPKTQDYSNNFSDCGTWQMWNSSPLGQDTLSMIGGTGNWPLLSEVIDSKEDIKSVPHKTMTSLFKNDDHADSGAHSSHDFLFGNAQNGIKFNESLAARVDHQWLPNSLFGSPLGSENQIVLRSDEEATRNDLINGTYSLSAANSMKEDGSMMSFKEGIGLNIPQNGGFHSISDVQSLWSYD